MTELQKYEKELTDVNSKLAELDDNRTKIIRLGIRLEGIIQYLRQKLKEEALAAASRDKAAVPKDSTNDAEDAEEVTVAASGKADNGAGDLKKAEVKSGKLE